MVDGVNFNQTNKLRIALGAFRTSPVQSLYAEASEPSLQHRRLKLAMNYYLKLRSLPRNPAYDNVFRAPPSEIFETSKTTPPFGIRVLPHILKAKINQEDIEANNLPDPPPWKELKSKFDFSLTKFPKEQTNPLIYKQEYLNLTEKYSDSIHLFTDGSKEDERVSAAVHCPRHPGFSASARLKDNTSVCGAELHAILLALNAIKNIPQRESFVIWSDSLSALQTINGDGQGNALITLTKLFLAELTAKEVIFVWLPGHMGICGNERADKLAKEARKKLISPNALLVPNDLKGTTNKYINEIWQKEWDLQIENKLHGLVPILTESLPTGVKNRREEAVLGRLHIGHSWLTHGFLLCGEEQPFCHSCDRLFSIKHILTECSDFADIRRAFYKETELDKLFKSISPKQIFGFLKEARLYHKI